MFETRTKGDKSSPELAEETECEREEPLLADDRRRREVLSELLLEDPARVGESSLAPAGRA